MSGQVDFLCGALAGAAADSLLFPLDTLRARQIMRPTRVGLLREAVALSKTEGVGALWKGLGVHLLVSVPSNGIFYSAFEAVRAAIAANGGATAVGSALGGAAGCLASLVLYTPMEVVKQRAMVTRGVDSLAVFRTLLREDGPMGLYRGVAAGALTWLPYFSLYFFAYDTLTATIGRVPSGEQPDFLTALGCGLVAGVGASLVTNPFDVVKTRLQVGGSGLGAGAGGAAATSGLAVARQIATSEGLVGFTRGCLPRALLLAPVSSLTIAFYAVFQQVAEGVLARRRKRE